MSGDQLIGSETKGPPEVIADETFGGSLAAQFNDSANYIYDGMTDKYDMIRNSVSMEMLVRVDAVTGSYDYPFTNLQDGGLGFVVYSDNTVKFTFNIGGKGCYVYSPAASFTPGEVFHAVGTYDGTAVRLYVNGILVGETAATGSLTDPTCRFMVIGADAQPSKAGDAPLTGAISVANIYSTALTADQIAHMSYVKLP